MKIEVELKNLQPLIDSIVREVVTRVLAEIQQPPAKPAKPAKPSVALPLVINATERKPRKAADVHRGYVCGEEGMLTRKEAAELLRVTTKTVDSLVGKGVLRKQKWGDHLQSWTRICARSVRELLEREY